jgi:hypothetical protein
LIYRALTAQTDKERKLSLITHIAYKKLDTLIRAEWYNEGMLEGKCSKCGTYRIGWALRFPRHQICPKCGAALVITLDGQRISKGYSPFTAEEYTINLPTNISPSHEKEKGQSQQSK